MKIFCICFLPPNFCYSLADIEQGAKAYFPLTSDSDRTWVSELRRLNGDDKNDARDSAINSIIFINPAVERIRGDKSVFRRAWLLNVGLGKKPRVFPIYSLHTDVKNPIFVDSFINRAHIINRMQIKNYTELSTKNQVKKRAKGQKSGKPDDCFASGVHVERSDIPCNGDAAIKAIKAI